MIRTMHHTPLLRSTPRPPLLRTMLRTPLLHSRPAVALLLAVLGLALLDAGSLSATVALAATAAAGAALAVCSLAAARCAPAVPRTRVRTAIRDRARRTAFLPQRDPDASGRPRPRAPGRALPTAVA